LGVVSGLSLGRLVSNLKSVALIFFELLAFNSHDRLLRTQTDRQTDTHRTNALSPPFTNAQIIIIIVYYATRAAHSNSYIQTYSEIIKHKRLKWLKVDTTALYLKKYPYHIFYHTFTVQALFLQILLNCQLLQEVVSISKECSSHSCLRQTTTLHN